jgi:hypothetical protein
MTRDRLTAAVWFVLALITIFLVSFSDLPRWVVALSAWFGGLVTAQMYRIFREGEGTAPYRGKRKA